MTAAALLAEYRDTRRWARAILGPRYRQMIRPWHTAGHVEDIVTGDTRAAMAAAGLTDDERHDHMRTFAYVWGPAGRGQYGGAL